jgi:hypothetical protein
MAAPFSLGPPHHRREKPRQEKTRHSFAFGSSQADRNELNVAAPASMGDAS